MSQSRPAIDQLGTYRPRLNADAFAHLSKDRRDWLEVFGNTWGDTVKQMPGTCERCVWGSGEHSVECATQFTPPHRFIGGTVTRFDANRKLSEQ